MIPNKKLHQELFLSVPGETKPQLQFSMVLLLFLVALQPTRVHSQTTLNDFDCCAVKKVEGSEDLGGTYYLVDVTEETLPDSCKDSCIYKKGEDDDRRFCFKSSETHQTECQAVDLEDAAADNFGDTTDGFSTTEEPTQIAGSF